MLKKKFFLQHRKIPSLQSFPCHVGHCVWVQTKFINGVEGVARTKFRVVRTDGQTDVCTYGEVQILIPTHNFVGGLKSMTGILTAIVMMMDYRALPCPV